MIIVWKWLQDPTIPLERSVVAFHVQNDLLHIPHHTHADLVKTQL
jgi:hypothetical protein